MSRLPDYKLKALDKRTEQRGEIGAGWANTDGSISVKLNAFVALAADPEVVLTLFPADKRKDKHDQAAAEDAVREMGVGGQAGRQ